MLFDSITNAYFLLLIFTGAADQYEHAQQWKASARVEPGMTHHQVREILGEPDAIYHEGWAISRNNYSSQWMYGLGLDLHDIVLPGVPFPNPLPISLRLFSWDEDDVVISWSQERTVVDVQRPDEFSSPEAFRPVYETFQLIGSIRRILTSGSG